MNNNRKLKIKKLVKKGATISCVQCLLVVLVSELTRVLTISQVHSLYRQQQIALRSLHL